MFKISPALQLSRHFNHTVGGQVSPPKTLWHNSPIVLKKSSVQATLSGHPAARGPSQGSDCSLRAQRIVKFLYHYLFSNENNLIYAPLA